MKDFFSRIKDKLSDYIQKHPYPSTSPSLGQGHLAKFIDTCNSRYWIIPDELIEGISPFRISFMSNFEQIVGRERKEITFKFIDITYDEIQNLCYREWQNKFIYSLKWDILDKLGCETKMRFNKDPKPRVYNGVILGISPTYMYHFINFPFLRRVTIPLFPHNGYLVP